MKDEKSDQMYVIGSTRCHMAEVRKVDEGNKKKRRAHFASTSHMANLHSQALRCHISESS